MEEKEIRIPRMQGCGYCGSVVLGTQIREMNPWLGTAIRGLTFTSE
jgi:hypothetical protein